MTRYEVYTLRRTAAFTVYAAYDNLSSQPVCRTNTNEPITSRDRAVMEAWARDWNRNGRP